MAISRQAIDALSSMGEQFGLAWQANARKTRGTDGVLNICIGDGYAPTKIDGWIHACTLTTKAIIKYAADKDAGLDIVGVTSWSGGNSALRYARWQANFHWKIDTRPGKPLRQVLADRDLPRDKADAFLDEAIPVIRAVFAADRPVDPENLPDLNVARPLHPRYAPPDPLEPLHWEVPNTL